MEEAYLSILRTATVLERVPHEIFRKAGITNAQFNVLRILRGSPKGLSRNEISDRVLTNVPDMTRLLDRLEKAGLIIRNRSTTDRRYVNTMITDKGRLLLDELDAPLRERFESVTSHITEEEARTLTMLLQKVREPIF